MTRTFSSLHSVISEHNPRRFPESTMIAQLQDCLLDDPSLLNAGDCFGLTPLHYAVEFDYVDAVLFLLRQGADVNARDVYGDTPLKMCYTYFFLNPRRLRIVRILQCFTRLPGLMAKWRGAVRLFLCYRRSVERVWAVGGVGYLAAKTDFLEHLHSTKT